MKIKLITFITIITSFCSFGQTKLPLNHSVYDNWKSLSNQKLSNNGKWISYEINPQKGDGYLYIYNINSEVTDSIERGYKSKFSPDNSFIAFAIRTQADTIREAKIAKLKKDKMPKDSLGIYTLKTGKTLLFDRIRSYKIPNEKGNFICILSEEPVPVKDTTKIKKKKKTKSKSDPGTDLKIYFPKSEKTYSFNKVKEYTISENGKYVSMIISENDSIEISKIILFNTTKRTSETIFEKLGVAKKLSFDKNEKSSCFIHSSDTIENKTYSLYFSNLTSCQFESIVDTTTKGIPNKYSVSEHSNIYFSDDGNRIILDIAPIPQPISKDTIPDDEKVSLDIWHWKDKRLQSKQLVDLKNDKKKRFKSVWDIKNQSLYQIEDEIIDYSTIPLKNCSEYAIGFDKTPYERQRSWDADYKKDVYLIDIKNHKKSKLLTEKSGYSSISKGGKFIIWFNYQEKSWYTINTITKKQQKISANIKHSFTNELHDTPNQPNIYGVAGWIEEDEFILVYDRFDIWKMDPNGLELPVRLTKGREENISYRYVNLDPEQIFIEKDSDIFLRSFNEKTKGFGFYLLSLKNLKIKLLKSGDYNLDRPIKAKYSDRLIWKKMTFREYPDLWTSNLKFSTERKISNTNPQQKNYNWGNVELVKWHSNNTEHEGLLYKPENFDPDKKYPMLVYFYERYSDRLHNHYVPKPIRSVVNFSYYASNGYFIFVPDIKYTVGYPGEDAREQIIEGTKAMLKRTYIDKENIGIQGQSWGGYQVAYLVTKTNIYKAAMAGAPVSNMTSAYGGIRWSSGRNRMFQYEMGQSRIGANLWESPELYMENSPLFFADKIETPLLIMHNDNDGAVPWYQGIELFVALRRLDKPVWMLNYNNAPHNLKRRADCEDLTVRMQQFFDHYLKEKPSPEWLLNGIPAIEKDSNKGFKLIE